MYSYEELAQYPFFLEAMTQTPPAAMHDALTGLIARTHILCFIQSLIAEKTPFVMGIVDLDNFKSINDNYGHRTGDDLLVNIARGLQSALGSDGVVGRYGGDEFLFVYFAHTDYDGLHSFLDRMYAEGGLFRRNLTVRGRTIFSTATIGCAVYPQDADSFETLFALADKTLYRGKSKGRNCFIIYVPKKHAHLEIPSLARRSLYDTLYRMAAGFDAGGSVAEKLRLAFDPMRENLRLHRLFFIDADARLLDPEGGAEEVVESPRALLQQGLFACHDFSELRLKCPTLAEKLFALGFESVMVSEVTLHGVFRGCLVFCPEAHSLHIWQDNEGAAACFLSRLLAEELARADG